MVAARELASCCRFLSSTWCPDLAPAPAQIEGLAGLSNPVGGRSLRVCGRRLLREVVTAEVPVAASPGLTSGADARGDNPCPDLGQGGVR